MNQQIGGQQRQSQTVGENSISNKTSPIITNFHPSHHSTQQTPPSHIRLNQSQQQQTQPQQQQLQQKQANASSTLMATSQFYPSEQAQSPQRAYHDRPFIMEYSSQHSHISHNLYTRQNAVLPQYFNSTGITPPLRNSDSMRPSQSIILSNPYQALPFYHSSSLTDSLPSPLTSSSTNSSSRTSDPFLPDIFNQNSAQNHSPSSPSDADQNGHHRNPFLDKSLCVVCGDKARGCNFGAITCASCKEFFRRNAFKLDKLRCYFQNKCEINVHSRRFCAACRLIKCNKSGMKSDYIMSEQEKQERQMKIHERKIARQGSNTNFPHSVISEQTFNPFETMFVQTSQIENIPNHNGNNISIPSPNPLGSLSSAFIDETESQIKAMMKKVKIIRESHYYQSMFQLHLHSSQADKALQEHEECKIRYLTTIVQIMQAETITQMPNDNHRCIDLVSLTNIIMFNFIKLCKKLAGYNQLTLDDQINLIKERGMESLILWSTMIIDLEKERWEILDVERNIRFCLKLENLREANQMLYDEHRQYVSSFEEDWRFNENIMSLLMVITLFDIDSSSDLFIDPEIIREIKSDYCKLLKTYLATLYEESVVERNYERLLHQIINTKQISEKHMRAHYDALHTEPMCKDGDYRGYIMEIFDLNN